MSLFEELKRRNVFRVGIAYVVAAWLLLQVSDLVLENINAPDWIMQVIMLVLAIGFPIAVILAWAFEMTPEGVKREHEVDRTQSITPQTGKKLNRLIIIALGLTVAWFLFDEFYFEPREAADGGGRVQQSSETIDVVKSIAVLPFVNLSSDPEQEYFADGLTEEILNSLAQLPELKVTARTSSFHFKGQDLPVGEIAETLGVAHIVEGSVRTSGKKVRITAQLIRADDGFHLWSETYDRGLEDSFGVQEDIAENIARALEVVMDEEQRRLMALAGSRDPEAFIAFQKGRELYSLAHGDKTPVPLLREANVHFERAIEISPQMAPAYKFHSDLFTHLLIDYASGVEQQDFSAEDIPATSEAMEHDFRETARLAPDEDLRMVADLDLMLVTGNWRGLAAQRDKVLAAMSCQTANWTHLASAAFGRAEEAAQMWDKAARCDPLSGANRIHLARSTLWAGQSELALKRAQRGLEYVDHPWLLETQISALVALGRPEDARQVADLQSRNLDTRLQSLLMISASEGDKPAARELMQTYLQDSGPDDRYFMVFNAQIGDREEANRLAAIIDARPYGHISLLMATYTCLCGAPFDLEATPNFAEKLAISGLPWPPESPITFPLKDW